MRTDIQQRDWDDSIHEAWTPKWDGVGCCYCGNSDRMITVCTADAPEEVGPWCNDGDCAHCAFAKEIPCPVCGGKDERACKMRRLSAELG